MATGPVPQSGSAADMAERYSAGAWRAITIQRLGTEPHVEIHSLLTREDKSLARHSAVKAPRDFRCELAGIERFDMDSVARITNLIANTDSFRTNWPAMDSIAANIVLV